MARERRAVPLAPAQGLTLRVRVCIPVFFTLGGGALWVDVVRITFGGKKDPNTGLYDDPLRYILYYNPRDGVITLTEPSEDAPMTCPRSYEEVKVRIYCKQDRDACVLASLSSAASSWRSEVLASSPCSAFATTPPPPRLSVRSQATPH